MENELAFLAHHRDDRREVVFHTTAGPRLNGANPEPQRRSPVDLLAQVSLSYGEASIRQLRNISQAALKTSNRFPVCESVDLVATATESVTSPTQPSLRPALTPGEQIGVRFYSIQSSMQGMAELFGPACGGSPLPIAMVQKTTIFPRRPCSSLIQLWRPCCRAGGSS